MDGPPVAFAVSDTISRARASGDRESVQSIKGPPGGMIRRASASNDLWDDIRACDPKSPVKVRVGATNERRRASDSSGSSESDGEDPRGEKRRAGAASLEVFREEKKVNSNPPSPRAAPDPVEARLRGWARERRRSYEKTSPVNRESEARRRGTWPLVKDGAKPDAVVAVAAELGRATIDAERPEPRSFLYRMLESAFGAGSAAPLAATPPPRLGTAPAFFPPPPMASTRPESPPGAPGPPGRAADA